MKSFFCAFLICSFSFPAFNQVTQPLLASDTFTVISCSGSDLSCIPLDIIANPPGHFVPLCTNIARAISKAVLFSSASTNGSSATFRVKNLSASSNLSIIISKAGSSNTIVEIPPLSQSEIISGNTILRITAILSCTTIREATIAEAKGVFQLIK